MNRLHLSALLGALSLLFVDSVMAQEQRKGDFSRFEITASWGWAPTDGHRPWYKTGYHLSFDYFPKSWLSVGVAVGNTPNFKDFILAPSVTFHWFRKRYFTMYSELGCYFIPSTKEEHRYFSEVSRFQLNPIGVTFGRSVFGSIELGYGPYPLRAGVGYRF